MKSIISVLFFFVMTHAPMTSAAPICDTYSIRCDCFPNVPFEGFKLYVVEKCDGEEKWVTEFYAPTFDSEDQCRKAITTDTVCQHLSISFDSK